MTFDWPNILRGIITLLVVIDLIGTIPVFMFATMGVPRELHSPFAFRAVLVATGVLLILVLAITLMVLLFATRSQNILGATGASVISRVMGLVLAIVAVDAVLGGFESLGDLNIIESQMLDL